MQRIKSIDLARGFTVLFIPMVHAVMVYGNEATYASALVSVLAFVAEWPGAEVFMLLMGISFALSKQSSFKRVMLRSCVLLAGGYLLNAIRFLIPYFAGGLPESFMNNVGANGWQSLLLIGDIFHFAALALLVLYVVKRLPEYPVIAILLVVVICFASPNWWDMHSDYFIADQLLQFLSGQPPRMFFPLLPWIVYPLSGLAAGYFMKRCVVSTHVVLLFFGMALFFISSSIHLSVEGPAHSFYRTTAWDTLRHLGFVFVWLSLWWLVTEFFADNVLFRFLVWCSRRITLIYVVQWPLIFWLLPVMGYRQLGLIASVIVSTGTTGVVLACVYWFTRRKLSELP